MDSTESRRSRPFARGHLLAKGDAVKAEAEYTRLAASNQKLASPRLCLAMLYQQQGRTDAAIRSYRSAIAIDPKLVLTYNKLAWILSAQRNALAEAERMARKAGELAPDVPNFPIPWVRSIVPKVSSLNPTKA